MQQDARQQAVQRGLDVRARLLETGGREVNETSNSCNETSSYIWEFYSGDIYTREEDSKLHISSAQLHVDKKIASKEISVVLGSQMLSKQSQEGHKSERGPDKRLFAL